MHEGHRARMYAKFLTDTKLHDHEILEMLLFAVVKRKNTNELAHRLLDSFGSINAVLSASMNELLKVEGVGVETAKFLNVLGIFVCMHDGKKPQPIKYDDDKFMEFVDERYKDVEYDVFDVYIFNDKDFIVDKRSFINEDQNKFIIGAEEVLEYIASFDSVRYVVFSYNHRRSVSAAPSDEEDAFVLRCYMVLFRLGIEIKDFFIYHKKKTYSYKKCGGMVRVRESEKKFGKI